jgi:hypothetical protein
VEEAQIAGEMSMESLGAINMIEMSTKITLSTPPKIEWHLKSRCISGLWRAIGTNPLSCSPENNSPINSLHHSEMRYSSHANPNRLQSGSINLCFCVTSAVLRSMYLSRVGAGHLGMSWQ